MTVKQGNIRVYHNNISHRDDAIGDGPVMEISRLRRLQLAESRFCTLVIACTYSKKPFGATKIYTVEDEPLPSQDL